jgi:hypothetical protein
MKTLMTMLWLVVFAVLALKQGICQQAIKPNLSAEATVTGVIKTMTRGSDLVLSIAEEGGRISDMTIILPKEVKVVMDDGAANADDLRIGRVVTVAYALQNTVPVVNDVPAGETTAPTAKSISIIFGNDSLLAGKKTVQKQTSAGIPAGFIGSWISTGAAITEKIQITTNHIRWIRNVLDSRDVYDLNSDKLDDKGDVSFDVKVLLATDVYSDTTAVLKARGGRLFMKVGPAFADIGYAKLSNPGEERVYVRDQSPDAPENKPSSGQ